jgi:signal transduction histidine kinase
VHNHSGSDCVIVRLARTDGKMILRIIDRGRGLPKGLLEGKNEKFRIGVGISGMRQRMHQLGGLLEITSNGDGTTVRASVPCFPGAAAPTDTRPAAPPP